ncbi:unnamed protein product [Mytilus coruscus]|uniref:MAM domain-containing protein n=1 Tax=Mytilus coruscus TaxID=42192 RepID=A0A6J8D7H2_MYTCO|nr:unnamed protein product [Mytilus coruscus]
MPQKDFKSISTTEQFRTVITYISGIYQRKDDYIMPEKDGQQHATDGKYAYIYSSGSEERQKAELSTEYIVSSKTQCLSFWYYKTDSYHTLEVLKNRRNIYTIKGTSENRWIRKDILFEQSTPNYMYKIAFKVVRSDQDIDGVIALDDIFLVNGACKDVIHKCDFENDTCNWHEGTDEDKYSDYSWSRQQGQSCSDPKRDYTTGSGRGHYMCFNGINMTRGDITYIQSPVFKLFSVSCLSFWYYMHGNESGRLNVTVNENFVMTKFIDQSLQWNKEMIDIDPIEKVTIKFIAISGTANGCSIALDDIVLTQGSCLGLHTHKCVHLDWNTSAETCPKKYLKKENVDISFEPETAKCSEYRHDRGKIKESFLHNCSLLTDEHNCELNLSDNVQLYPECFRLHEFQIKYKCENEKSTTVSSDITSRGDSTAVSGESVTLSRVLRNSSDSETGLVVGLVIGGLLLACVVILIVVLIRKHKFESRPRKTMKNNLAGNDYIGSQDIALPQTDNHSSHIQYFDKQTSIDDEYAIVDPTAETSFNEIIDDGNRTADSYMILDPNDTGFNRTPFSNTPTGYEFAKPVKDKIIDDDQYDISHEGVYDHSGSSRHKELEGNIYNHAVDTIYDSGSHKRINEGRENTYDHFFGQKTEDEYDISTTT